MEFYILLNKNGATGIFTKSRPDILSLSAHLREIIFMLKNDHTERHFKIYRFYIYPIDHDTQFFVDEFPSIGM